MPPDPIQLQELISGIANANEFLHQPFISLPGKLKRCIITDDPDPVYVTFLPYRPASTMPHVSCISQNYAGRAGPTIQAQLSAADRRCATLHHY
eukprot:scaffold55552_cov75-Cyclotella_meneghiniana.AAC.3